MTTYSQGNLITFAGPIASAQNQTQQVVTAGLRARPSARQLPAPSAHCVDNLANDELALSASLGALADEEMGWITLSEARALFGEMDQVGKASLVAFAELLNRQDRMI